MKIAISISILILAYLIGSIPFGLLIVKFMSGRDLRGVGSGRTGGTNAMRAAGPWAGVLTAVLDALKAAGAVWLARLFSANVWILVLAPVAAIFGHNASIFMPERDGTGKLRFRGGAGGAPTVGGAFGLWPPLILILLPLSFLIWYGIGYASFTTICIALITLVAFTVRALQGLSPWEYVIYGAVAELLVLLALRPNLRRLLDGTERLHGWRARKSRQGTHPD